MEHPKRRQFLRLAGVTGTIALTGCQRSFTGERTRPPDSNDADGNGVFGSGDGQADGDSTPTETAATVGPVVRVDDALPDGFKNGGAVRKSTDITLGASGEYAWVFDGESYIRTDYTWGKTDHSGTLSSWVYVPSSAANVSGPRYLVSVRDSTPQPGEFDTLSLMQDADAGIGLRKKINGNSALTADAFASDYPLDQWFHLIGVVDKAANETRVYINGEQRDVGGDSDITIEHGTEFGIGAQAKAVGGTSYQYDGHFTGTLDDVRIYDIALEPEDIPRV